MPTPNIYIKLAARTRACLTLRNILIGAPILLGLALFDNAWGQNTYHIAGRLLTSLVILWVPITFVALLFAPKRLAGSNSKPISRPHLKATICNAVTVLFVAFLCLVQAQEWRP